MVRLRNDLRVSMFSIGVVILLDAPYVWYYWYWLLCHCVDDWSDTGLNVSKVILPVSGLFVLVIPVCWLGWVPVRGRRWFLVRLLGW